MEVDLSIVNKDEIDYWCKEFPDLDREEVALILDVIDMNNVKDEFWKINPTLNEDAVNKVVAENASASYDYHIYHTFNNEAQ